MCKQKIKSITGVNTRISTTKGRQERKGGWQCECWRGSVGLESDNKQRCETRQGCLMELWCGSEISICLECQSPGFNPQYYNARQTMLKGVLVNDSFLVTGTFENLIYDLYYVSRKYTHLILHTTMAN